MHAQLRILLVFSLFLMFGLFRVSQTQALSLKITEPRNGTRFDRCADITIKAQPDIASSDIRRILFYFDGKNPRGVRNEPWEYTYEQIPDGIYNIYAKLTTNDRENVMSDTIQVFVGPVEDGEKLKNGEFACGTAPWNLALTGEADATLNIEPEGWLSEEPSMAYIDIINPGSQNWHVMLTQPCPLDSGHTYQVYFMAEVEDSKTIGVDFQSTTGDYTVHYWESVELDFNTYEYGPIEWFCPVNDPSTEFKLAISEDKEYIYFDAIKVIDKDWVKNTTQVEERSHGTAGDFRLKQNHPNPFNPNTTIEFDVPQSAPVKLSIYDVQGRWINTLVDGVASAGAHTVSWQGKNARGRSVPSGVYFYHLQCDDFTATKQMLLIR